MAANSDYQSANANLLIEGIELFNRQEFFECHEVLEDLWRQQSDPERQFTQGLIQVAVGYHHLLRGNHAGAVKLFKRGIGRLKEFLPVHNDVDLTNLLKTVETVLANLDQGGKPDGPIARITVGQKRS
jgi:predicted metal-dependent hydrolase